MKSLLCRLRDSLCSGLQEFSSLQLKPNTLRQARLLSLYLLCRESQETGCQPQTLSLVLSIPPSPRRHLQCETEKGRGATGQPEGHSRPVATSAGTLVLRPARPEEWKVTISATVARSGWRTSSQGTCLGASPGCVRALGLL